MLVVWPLVELSMVRVKKGTRAKEMVRGEEVEIKTGWEGTIVADADSSAPMVEFNDYGPNSVLVNLGADNLEVVH